MEALRGRTSNLAVSYYVIDVPDGGGKIPMMPEYVISVYDERVLIRNFRGEICVYPHQVEEEGEEEFPFDPQCVPPPAAPVR